MSINIYELQKVDGVKLFKRNDEVNDMLFDLVESFQSDAISAKQKAEKCYSILNAPCFGEGAECSGTDVPRLIESIFGALLKAATVKKYALIVDRFAMSDDQINRTVYDIFPVGKLIILSPLTSKKNVESGYSVPAFFLNIGIMQNNKVREKHEEWEQTNADTLEMISDMESLGKHAHAEKLAQTLTAEPDTPIDENDAESLVNLGISICKLFSDKQLKTAVSNYLPEKSNKAEGKAEGQAEGKANGQVEETPEEKYARIKAEFAEKFAEFIVISEETGNKVTETMKQVARKVGVDV